jgi:hypothetical protein
LKWKGNWVWAELKNSICVRVYCSAPVVLTSGLRESLFLRDDPPGYGKVLPRTLFESQCRRSVSPILRKKASIVSKPLIYLGNRSGAASARIAEQAVNKS